MNLLITGTREMVLKQINKYTIQNEFLRVTILNVGAVIYKLEIMRNGNWENMVLTFDDIEQYRDSPDYIGVGLCGRTAGRIENSAFKLNDKDYVIDKNFMDKHNLHGGYEGLHKQFSDVTVNDNQIICELTESNSQYPGNMNIKVYYQIDGNTLTQKIEGITDEDTIFNPTNHAYFNFDMSKDILDYKLEIDAKETYYLNKESIPNKKISMEKSIFSGLNTSLPLRNMMVKHEQFEYVGFIDHPFILNSGNIKMTNDDITLNITTNQNCLVVYSGNYLGDLKEKVNGAFPKKNHAICLETQMMPNAINTLEYCDDIILRKNDKKIWETKYSFTY